MSLVEVTLGLHTGSLPIPVTAEEREVEFDPLQGDALKLREPGVKTAVVTATGQVSQCSQCVSTWGRPAPTTAPLWIMGPSFPTNRPEETRTA